MFAILACTLPDFVEYIGQNPRPFPSDCPESSRGELIITFVLKSGSVQTLSSKNLTVSGGQFSFDFARQIDFNTVNYTHIYGNLTLNGVSKIVAVQYSPECTYAMKRMLVANKQYQFIVFPRNYDCKPYNLSDIQYKVYIRRIGINGDDLIISNKAFQFELNFDITIDDAIVTSQNIRYAYLFMQNRRFNLTEIDSAAPCIINNEITKTDIYIIARPLIMKDCYVSTPVLIGGNQFLLKQSRIEATYYQYQISTTTPTSLPITITEVDPITFTSSQKELFKIEVNSISRVFQYCNQSISQLQASKPYFNITGSVEPIANHTNLCVPFVGVYIALPTSIVNATILNNQNLSLIYLKSINNQIVFDFNTTLFNYAETDVIRMKFTGSEQLTRFVTPLLLQNCVFTAKYIFKRSNTVIAVSKQFCNPEKSEIPGYTVKNWQNYRNTAGSEFDMYLGVEYTGSGPIQSNLENYIFTRKLDSDMNSFVPFQYISQDELQHQQAELAAFETNNYNYKTWVNKNWWIFALTVIVVFVSSFSLLYGCKYPCKQIMVTKKVKVMAQQKAKRKMKMVV